MNTHNSTISKYLITKPALMLLLILPLLISSCDDRRHQTVSWTEFEPVYMTQEEFADAVHTENPRELENPGKIYFHEGYLYVNEVNKGVHIIDNRDPSSPANVGFVTIPANKDLAVSGNLLYADSHSDLLVFDISDLSDPKLISRKDGVFENIDQTMPRGFPFQEVDESRGIVVDWKEVEIEEVCDPDCSPRAGMGNWVFVTAESGASTRAVADGGGGGGNNTGIGGSMARFAITGSYLYAVDHQQLITFDINAQEPAKTNRQHIGWGIETIFPYNENLFIGSVSAMYIYDISNPDAPSLLSQYNHFTACDPVVVEGNYAYVTLRSGNTCFRGVDQLEVIDVKDLKNPVQVATYEMINPHGLGIDNGRLFISEGEHGLKIMDASNPRDIKELRHIKSIKTYDVIPFNNVLMVTGASGIIQYDYSDIDDVKQLSTIPVMSKK